MHSVLPFFKFFFKCQYLIKRKIWRKNDIKLLSVLPQRGGLSQISPSTWPFKHFLLLANKDTAVNTFHVMDFCNVWIFVIGTYNFCNQKCKNCSFCQRGESVMIIVRHQIWKRNHTLPLRLHHPGRPLSLILSGSYPWFGPSRWVAGSQVAAEHNPRPIPGEPPQIHVFTLFLWPKPTPPRPPRLPCPCILPLHLSPCTHHNS